MLYNKIVGHQKIYLAAVRRDELFGDSQKSYLAATNMLYQRSRVLFQDNVQNGL